MEWGGDNPTDRILMYLAEIGAGRCTITDDTIVAEGDPDMSQILLGLLVLHEDLSYASQQRTAAEERLRDIGEQRERLLEERRQAVAARDQFLAIAAHELRTPLATMALLVDHLMAPQRATPPAGGADDSPQRQQLNMLKRQVDRLTGLVAQMLDVSRITRGGLDLVVGPVDLRTLVREVLDRFALEFERRAITVTTAAPEPIPGTWDAERVDQVVTNLISNAIKYGAGRPIDVAVHATASTAVVMVRDQGVGIPEDEQRGIFEPFTRATTARHHAGLGLGLWIAQQIVLASGGRMTVESRVNQGSTFVMELPL